MVFSAIPVLQAADILLYRGTKVPVGPGPGCAFRTLARDRAPLQQRVRRDLRRAAAAPDADAEGSRAPTRARCRSRTATRSTSTRPPHRSRKVKIDVHGSDAQAATDLGHPEPCAENPPGCSVYAMHKLYADEAFCARRGEECRAGSSAAVPARRTCWRRWRAAFDDFRQAPRVALRTPGRRHPGRRRCKARIVARKTMYEVRRAMRLRLMTEKAYEVALEFFEGPLDLLLFLVKKDDLDINNIPIAHITKEYFAYLELMKDMDLDIAGDFLVMAATLMAMKSRRFCPASSRSRATRGRIRRRCSPRSCSSTRSSRRPRSSSEAAPTRWPACSTAARRISRRPRSRPTFRCSTSWRICRSSSPAPRTTPKTVEGEEFPIEEKMEKILFLLAEAPMISWEDLFADERKRRGIIACFLAMLELTKLQKIFIRQDEIPK